MNSTLQTLIRSVLKIGAGYVISHSLATGEQLHAVYAGAVALAAVYWGYKHRSTPAASSPLPAPSSRPPSGTYLMAFAALMLFTGCVGSPSKGHVVRIVGTGTKVGITQNPATQMYELGLLRFQTELTTIPLFFNPTNGNVELPDVVSSYEVNGGSAVFGRIGLTSTLATGSNGVATLLGGQHLPVNNAIGASNNIVNLQH